MVVRAADHEELSCVRARSANHASWVVLALAWAAMFARSFFYLPSVEALPHATLDVLRCGGGQLLHQGQATRGRCLSQLWCQEAASAFMAASS
jgi:hypothetical protein